ncbi:MAG: hypothetical protein DMG70_15760 [Acidobacteria bacterium]|nr:MAG: hypothetical protein DMG70_15760 [Acidobacteriota bacterium]
MPWKESRVVELRTGVLGREGLVVPRQAPSMRRTDTCFTDYFAPVFPMLASTAAAADAAPPRLRLSTSWPVTSPAEASLLVSKIAG